MRNPRILSVLASALVILSAICVSGHDSDEAPLPSLARGGFPPPIPGIQPFTIAWQRINPHDFIAEAFLLAGLCAMYYLYRRGKHISNEIAKNWYRCTASVWEKNFAQIGDAKNHKLIRDGPKDFIFYATGRVNVEMVYAFIETSPRHDLVKTICHYFPSQLLEQLGWKWTHDKILKAYLHDTASDDFVLAILPKKAAGVMKMRYDLKTFAKELREPSIRNFPFRHYVLASDCPEFAALLCQDAHVQKVLYAAAGLDEEGAGVPKLSYLESIIISDQPKRFPEKMDDVDNTSKTITCTFRLPDGLQDKKQVTKSQPLMVQLTELFIDLIDYVGQHGKFSGDVSARLNKIRAAAAVEIEKKKSKDVAEQLEKKKMEERKKKLEAAERAGPEALRRFEDKERKEQQRKQMKKAARKKMVVG
ncbi:hypothetical protein SeMB42_g06004 [Synchytrium endobioticum]|uniref:DUF1682 domain-containing protein n=1 Tax=Synchytrium endobioticum TaxID=286115 RepID=A0A507CL76_9FUNG|nr:hypothetical protein SeLEV6574_g07295 [Synchytrium endobioticum]TPX40449.1 hypothetical protein SeMB42_g06004 [Synchytrium endobioticum]